MGSLPAFGPWVGPVKYCWDIFSAPALRRSELAGTPYRYWSSFAIAYLLKKRLSGRIDFLDAGGRDGGTLSLLRGLGLHGSYTLMDLEPKMTAARHPDFEIEVVRSPFHEFQPTRQYDAILFQSCLEYVESYSDIAWIRKALKPGGFMIATIACKNTRRLYWGVWAQGGRYLLDEEDLAGAFGGIGLKMVWACPLGGAVSRVYQRLIFNSLHYRVMAVHQKTTARLFPNLKQRHPLALAYRPINAAAAVLDRLLPFWRIGHCVVLERAE
jgi:SAM-dependent methyltransferase